MDRVHKKYLTTTALVWAGCLVLFIFAYMLILKPQKRSEDKMQRQLAEKKQEYQTMLASSTESAKIRLKKELEEDRNKLRKFVTDAEGSANLTFDISKIANETRVSSFSIKSKDSREAMDIPQCEHIAENRIDISFNSNFNQFASFLNSLERHSPVVFVDWFKIRRGSSSEIENDINMGLSVFVEKRQDS
ncbi:MAG: type II secretion system protein GspM [Phycisphaerales bacterium]